MGFHSLKLNGSGSGRIISTLSLFFHLWMLTYSCKLNQWTPILFQHITWCLEFLLYAKYMVIFRYPMTPTKKKRRPDANAQRYKSKLPYVSPTMTCLIKKEQGSRGHPRHYQHRYILPCLYSLCGVMVYCDLWCVTFSIRGSEFNSESCHFLCMCDVWYSFPFSLIVRVSVTKELYFLISSSYVLLKFWILLGTMLRQLGKFVNG